MTCRQAGGIDFYDDLRMPLQWQNRPQRVKASVKTRNRENNLVAVFETGGSKVQIPIHQKIAVNTFDKANTAPEVYQQLFADHRDVYHNFIPIFTDGSKSSLSTSFACVFNNSTLSFQIHSSSSIFTAEITAILHALSEISSGPPDNFIIYSDSLSALESMTSLHRFSHPLTFNILELHDHLTFKGFSILLCWIPSHVGIPGNELADNLAKSATINLNSPVPVKDVKNYIKSILHSKWQA
ncbi:hypothetical protein AVEN_191834-1 [Araneus ventricosus]|uniref:ribonuclease H n=1 Tax=Araneus ventricosus TaxID=182803 RepID=A0A4Y2F3M3_ARAVE|nr:hypothetical protein AVEN_191834-1 [Araneus ventricosus]